MVLLGEIPFLGAELILGIATALLEEIHPLGVVIATVLLEEIHPLGAGIATAPLEEIHPLGAEIATVLHEETRPLGVETDLAIVMEETATEIQEEAVGKFVCPTFRLVFTTRTCSATPRSGLETLSASTRFCKNLIFSYEVYGRLIFY